MEKQNEPKPTKVICSNCGYEWTTMSQAMQVTCPSCINKTRREVKK